MMEAEQQQHEHAQEEQNQEDEVSHHMSTFIIILRWGIELFIIFM